MCLNCEHSLNKIIPWGATETGVQLWCKLIIAPVVEICGHYRDRDEPEWCGCGKNRIHEHAGGQCMECYCE